MRDGGKGDMQRPLGVELEQFDNNWDVIFKKKPKEYVLINGMTEEETNETTSVKGLSK
jgi:hypothetical protein